MYTQNYITSFQNGIANSIFEYKKEKIDAEHFFLKLIKKMNINSRLFFYGNGASMSFSIHMALDWFKNAKIQSHALGDVALLTALVNDYSKERMFAEHFKLFHPGENDILCVTSSSGNSSNVIDVLNLGLKLNCSTVGFSGLNVNNEVRRLSDFSVFVPLKTYGMVECVHQMFLHLWLDKFMNIEEWRKEESQNMDSENLCY
jgi:D-sedoheptulose 7-phosphate isomerase